MQRWRHLESSFGIGLSRVVQVSILVQNMSSSLQIPKTCIYCGKSFTAKTIITRYCSHSCNRKHYKEIKRLEKIASAPKIIEPMKEPKASYGKDMSIPEAARLLGVSDRTIFRLISKRIIRPIRTGRRVRILTNELLKLKVYDNLY